MTSTEEPESDARMNAHADVIVGFDGFDGVDGLDGVDETDDGADPVDGGGVRCATG